MLRNIQPLFSRCVTDWIKALVSTSKTLLRIQILHRFGRFRSESQLHKLAAPFNELWAVTFDAMSCAKYSRKQNPHKGMSHTGLFLVCWNIFSLAHGSVWVWWVWLMAWQMKSNPSNRNQIVSWPQNILTYPKQPYMTRHFAWILNLRSDLRHFIRIAYRTALLSGQTSQAHPVEISTRPHRINAKFEFSTNSERRHPTRTQSVTHIE